MGVDMTRSACCLIALLLLATLAVAETIHQQIFKCQRGEIADDNACMRVCETCHPSTATALGDMDIHQDWNSGQFTVDEVYPEDELKQALKITSESSNPWEGLTFSHRACGDCHEDQGDLMKNHPWHISYPDPMDYDSHFNEAPGQVKLFENEILCATCHNPHLNEAGNLRTSNQGSAMCLACHIK